MNKSLIIGLLLFIIGISLWFWWTSASYQPEFRRFENISITMEESDKAVLNLDVVLFNPSNMDAQLLNTELNLSSNDVRFAKISQTNLSQLKPSSEFHIPLNCDVNLSDLSASQGFSSIIEKALNEKRSLKVKFNGYCQVKFKSQSYRIPIAHEENIQFENIK